MTHSATILSRRPFVPAINRITASAGAPINVHRMVRAEWRNDSARDSRNSQLHREAKCVANPYRKLAPPARETIVAH